MSDKELIQNENMEADSGKTGYKQDFSESRQFHHQSSSNISKEKGVSNVSRVN